MNDPYLALELYLFVSVVLIGLIVATIIWAWTKNRLREKQIQREKL